MFTAAEIAFWSPDEVLQELMSQLPLGWKLTIREDPGYSAELYDAEGGRAWIGASWDQKLLYMEALGWLMTRDHKPQHPVWTPRERELTLRVPNPESNYPDPPDLDPKEVDAVYRNRR